ncbi:hypothetical protein EJ110_NYTH51466 [Nymphaea thermarum]|nr:hypothetical protein EJ110_NYTH51466 [Nymphaea thermarum]
MPGEFPPGTTTSQLQIETTLCGLAKFFKDVIDVRMNVMIDMNVYVVECALPWATMQMDEIEGSGTRTGTGSGYGPGPMGAGTESGSVPTPGCGASTVELFGAFVKFPPPPLQFPPPPLPGSAPPLRLGLCSVLSPRLVQRCRRLSPAPPPHPALPPLLFAAPLLLFFVVVLGFASWVGLIAGARDVAFETSNATKSENLPVQVKSIRLTKDNYLSWSAALEIGITSRVRLPYITGEKPAPSKTDPQWATWALEDSQVKVWIISSVSADIQPLILRKSTSFDMWIVLARMYGRKKRVLRTY